MVAPTAHTGLASPQSQDQPPDRLGWGLRPKTLGASVWGERTPRETLVGVGDGGEAVRNSTGSRGPVHRHFWGWRGALLCSAVPAPGSPGHAEPQGDPNPPELTAQSTSVPTAVTGRSVQGGSGPVLLPVAPAEARGRLGDSWGFVGSPWPWGLLRGFFWWGQGTWWGSSVPPAAFTSPRPWQGASVTRGSSSLVGARAPRPPCCVGGPGAGQGGDSSPRGRSQVA